MAQSAKLVIRGFESLPGHFQILNKYLFSSVWLEHYTDNVAVGGSNPLRGTIHKVIFERPKTRNGSVGLNFMF